MDWKILALIATPILFAIFAQGILDALHPNEVEEKECERRQKRSKSVEQMADAHPATPSGVVAATGVPVNHAAQLAQSNVERQRRRKLEEAHDYDAPADFAMPDDFDLAAARQL
ncbi:MULTISPECIES: hypothetical protein [unclassified Variovorax]|uniref:hypothetical protein n=1 Tax=unclassified Variovorax TaxID=663243 RepID=UPI000838FE34|nr:MULTISPECIES: hypothetical protein [unclassified Variovorax]PNG49988.1 hypothetical protein CHC06_05569 [Variovorax sp. B2]PNG50860.1 hypothetical protein CHC07_05474 [Variovorax sp. B4]VTU41664.1 hypothetical protein H6P1_00021 [Variovorax sp. PBL-H6]VTU44634.1 hypothetical protein SRS16P1_00882 [Variovorax sp. SRS16]VTU44682.1 hypothetical protein E5P1_00874 [Variovorax sp. PBL-E5]